MNKRSEHSSLVTSSRETPDSPKRYKHDAAEAAGAISRTCSVMAPSLEGCLGWKIANAFDRWHA
jgi:hypothetical protein